MHTRTHSFTVKNENGFTLVEILVSLVILLILVVAFVPMFTFVAQAVSNNQAKDTATALANKQIEYIRTLPFIVLDPATGQIQNNIDVPQLGIQGDANCPGSIKPEEDPILIEGKTYTVKTDVDWDNNADKKYKKVTVSVEYLSAFNNLEVVTNFYTISSEEGELKTSFTGNILVKILDKDGNHFEGAVVDVKITDSDGNLIASDKTADGERFFEDLEIGSYTVHAKVDGSLAYSPDQTLVGEWLVLDKQVTSNTTTDAAFYFDHPVGFSLKLLGDTGLGLLYNTVFTGTATLQLGWTNGTTTKNLTPIPVNFDLNDFDPSSQTIPAAKIKAKLGNVNLWPGRYTIKLTNVLDKQTLRTYTNYEESFDLTAGNTELPIKHFIYTNSLLKAHFDPDQGVTTPTDNRVSRWEDRTSKWYAVSETMKRPTQESGVLAGHSVMRFSSKNSYGNPTKFFIHSYVGSDEFTNNFTIVAVAKPFDSHDVETQSNTGTSGTSGQKYLFGPNNKGNNDAGAGLSLGTNGVSNYEHGNYYMPPTAVYSGEMNSAFKVITLRYTDPSDTNPKADIYVNGQLRANGLPSARSNVYSPTIIGGDKNDYGKFNGDLAYLLVYNTPLNDANIQLVTSELKSRFGL